MEWYNLPQMLQKAVKDKQRTLTKLQQEIKEKKKENAALDQELRELQVCILERKEIEDLAGKSSQARHNPWGLAPNFSLVFPMCSCGLTCHVYILINFRCYMRTLTSTHCGG